MKFEPKYKQYVLCIAIGMLLAVYICPPQPTVELTRVQREEVVQEVLERLEDNGYSIELASRDVRRGWFN